MPTKMATVGEPRVSRGNPQNELDDLFHGVIMSEERSQYEGFQEGRVEGQKRGIVEGCRLGFEKGAAIGSEIGFYKGYVETLQQLTTQSGDTKPRIQKSLQSLSTMLNDFPVLDVLSQSLFEDLERIRAKFKQVTSLLGIQMTYGDEENKAKGFTF